MRVVCGVNELGYRVGEDHQHAKLSNRDVDQVWSFRDEGFSYLKIARMMDVSKSQIRNIIKGYKRSQTPVRYKVMVIQEPQVDLLSRPWFCEKDFFPAQMSFEF